MTILAVISELDPKATIIVFVSSLLALLSVEHLIDFIVEWAESNKYADIYQKLQKQLLQLGLLSFVYFILEVFASESYFIVEALESFEFAELIIFFLAISFIIQACILVKFAILAVKKFVSGMNTSCNDLLNETKYLLASGSGWEKFLFLKAPAMLSFLSPLRVKVEYKILENLYLSLHDFPSEFNFGKYVVRLFKLYMVELGVVPVPSWILLIVLALLNYIRILFVPGMCDGFYKRTLVFDDDGLNAESLRNTTEANSTETNTTAASLEYWRVVGQERTPGLAFHRMLGSGNGTYVREVDEDACREYYFFAYASICMMLLCILTTYIYFITCYYFDFLIKEALNAGSTRLSLEEFLSEACKRENEMTEEQADAETMEVTATSARLLVRVKSKYAENRTDFRKKAKELKENKLRKKYKNARKTTAALLLSRLGKSFRRVFNVKKDQWKISEIFLFRWPGLYFRAVQMIHSLQCFYVAMWATQLLPLAANNGEGLWAFIVSLALLYNLFIFQLIISKSVLLRTVRALDETVLADVCDDFLQERAVVDDLSTAIRSKLVQEKIDKIYWKTYIAQKFAVYDVDNSNSLSKVEFRSFLGDLNIYLSMARFRLLWETIDVDVSGSISWEEIFMIVFPEMKSHLKVELMVAKRLREELQNSMAVLHLPREEWLRHLQKTFNHFDADNSGSIDRAEFKTMLDSLNIELSEKAVALLFASVKVEERRDPSASTISWEEFLALVDPTNALLPSSSRLPVPTVEPTAEVAMDRSSTLEPVKDEEEVFFV